MMQGRTKHLHDTITAVRKSFGEMVAFSSVAALGLSIWPVSEDNSLLLTMSLIALVLMFLNAPLFILDIACISSAAGSSDSSLLRPKASDSSYGESQAVDSHFKLQELSSTNAKATASWNSLSTFRAACALALDFIWCAMLGIDKKTTLKNCMAGLASVVAMHIMIAIQIFVPQMSVKTLFGV